MDEMFPPENRELTQEEEDAKHAEFLISEFPEDISRDLKECIMMGEVTSTMQDRKGGKRKQVSLCLNPLSLNPFL